MSVVTPVYNGDKYLSDCVESVLAQTYNNWEYVIVNNRSTDRTKEIAEGYAKKDGRVRLHNNEDFLGVIQNWNHAVRQISPRSKYCKIIHADDLLFPECIERMVEVAEANPNVAITGSYILQGNGKKSEICCTGIPYPQTVVSGKEINRAAFQNRFFVFGNPTATLVRADLVRGCEKFYNEGILYSDIDMCFRLLQDHDFGFVHQVLSFVRLHDESQTITAGEPLNKANVEFLGMLVKNGPTLFDGEEYKKVLEMRFRRYYRFLGKNLLLGRKKEFWDYHRKGLEGIGYPFSKTKLARGLFSELLFMLLNLNNTYDRVSGFVEKRRQRVSQ